jgi:hypothetical protein
MLIKAGLAVPQGALGRLLLTVGWRERQSAATPPGGEIGLKLAFSANLMAGAVVSRV